MSKEALLKQWEVASKHLYYLGTVVEFVRYESRDGEPEKFILAQLHEKGYVFQIIGIEGMYSGYLEGYIKEQDELKGSYKAVTKQHLINELVRNFGPINTDDIKIMRRDEY